MILTDLLSMTSNDTDTLTVNDEVDKEDRPFTFNAIKCLQQTQVYTTEMSSVVVRIIKTHTAIQHKVTAECDEKHTQQYNTNN